MDLCVLGDGAEMDLNGGEEAKIFSSHSFETSRVKYGGIIESDGAKKGA